MNDLISRQAAIDTVKNMRECCDTNDINDYYDLLHEAFNVLPSAQPEQQWIPCSEKLPEEGVKVLITCGDDHVYIAKLRKGISKAERELMKAGKLDNPVITAWNSLNGIVECKRSEIISGCDEAFNNKVPYCWDCDHGSWFGQDYIAWMPLPEPYKAESEDKG